MQVSEVLKRGTHTRGRVLVIDDDTAAASRASSVLSAGGFHCEICVDADEALSRLSAHSTDVVVADMHLAGSDATALLSKIRKSAPGVSVIIAAQNPSVGSAVAAMRRGAFDYVTKPFNGDELVAVVARAVQLKSLHCENRRLKQQLDVASMTAGFIAESRKTNEMVAMIRRVAPARSTVLIQGESGTGKELIARMLHYWSRRAEGPFIAVNCKAFADGVVESELFGHEKGSFTGAISARAGCFERASGGTLFLDEIAEAGADFQAKLLRVLEDGEVMRVGGSKPRSVDVRIVTATNRELRREVDKGRFRADLYFRLNVIPIHIEPLRKRTEDIMALARHFLACHEAETGRPLSLSPEAVEVLLAYPWPGNVRELQNVIERAVVMSGAEVITPEAFALEPAAAAAIPDEDSEPEMKQVESAGTLQECLDRAASERIRVALKEQGGNRAEAAASLGVDRTTLYRLMKRLSI